MGAALAVRVCSRRAGVRVRSVVIVIVLGYVFLPYSPVSGAEANQQALVVETAALLPERILGERQQEQSMKNKERFSLSQIYPKVQFSHEIHLTVVIRPLRSGVTNICQLITVNVVEKYT